MMVTLIAFRLSKAGPKGQNFEKVYDVAWSGHRKPDPATGKVPAVGSTVDIKEATYTNSIGAAELKTVLDRSGIRSEPARILLYSCFTDSDPALEHLRRS